MISMQLSVSFRCPDPECPGRPEPETPCEFVIDVDVDAQTGSCDGEIIGPRCVRALPPDFVTDTVRRAAQKSVRAAPMSSTATLGEYLEANRWTICAAAQRVYDEWEQDQDGQSFEYGSGGICDAIAESIAGELDCAVREGGWDGDDHAWLIVSDGREAYMIDIPADVYETGAGLRWTKRPGVVFAPGHVLIANLGDEFAFTDEY